MSDTVGTCAAPLCHVQDHPGSVPITIGGVTALLAPENPLTQQQTGLGSRPAITASHGGVGGRHQHHPSARPHASLDNLTLGGTDRGVCRLAGHGRSGQKLWFEVLDRDRLMVVDDPPRPDPRCMDVLPLCFFLHQRSASSRPLVPVARRLTTGPPSACHASLCLGQLLCGTVPISFEHRVVGGICGCGSGLHAPVHTDARCSRGRWYQLASHHERGVPVSQTVLVDLHRRRLGGQFPRPHDRYHSPLGEPKASSSKGETVARVTERGKRPASFFERRPAGSAYGERSFKRPRIVVDHLSLTVLGAFAEPETFGAREGEQLSKLRPCRSSASSLLMNGFVPQEPASVPLSNESALCDRAGTQSILVAHDLQHLLNTTRREGKMHPFLPAPPDQQLGITEAFLHE